jgi:hypothetical protein
MPVTRDFSNYFKAVEDTAPQVNESAPKIKYKVEDVFKPVFKNGETEVVMRFLPSHPNEFKPFIENRAHMYEYEPGKFFGCDCLEKYGVACPICDHNHKLYTSGKYTKEEASPLRLPAARRRFVSNVYIVKNNNAPDTEGKVYRFEYGIQIMDMIRKAMTGYVDPEDGEVEGYNPFDWKNGANFIYKGVSGAKGPNIKDSKFGKRRPISDKNGKELTVAEIDKIEAQLYTLDEYERKINESPDYNAIRGRFKNKLGYGLFDKFIGTKEEVVICKEEMVIGVPAAKTPAVQTSIVEDAAEANSNVKADEETFKANKAVEQDDFFASLEDAEE